MWLSQYNMLWVHNGFEVNHLVSIDTTGEKNGGKKYYFYLEKNCDGKSGNPDWLN